MGGTIIKQNSLYVKGIAIFVIVLFIGMIINPLTAMLSVELTHLPISEGTTLYVGGSGPNNYTWIQDAIDNASNGDTIFVYNSTYYEIVNIYKPIFLIGEDKNTTIIQANESDFCVKITAYGVEITGFTIKRVGHVYYSDGAISISSTHNMIRGNIILDTNSSGVYIRDPSHSNTISNNTIIGISGYGTGGIDSYFSSNNQIIGNHISGFYRGVKFGEGSNNIVTGNNFENNKVGVFLYQSYNSDITHNDFMNNREFGIWLMGCAFDEIINNSIYGSSIGIDFGGAIYTNVSENTITQCNVGIYVSSVSHGKFYRNNVSNNDDEDILIIHAIDNLTIIDNYFEDGIVFGYEDELEYWNTHTIKDNHAHNGPIRFYKNMKDKVVSYNTAQVILANCTGFRIEHLNLTGLERGIVLGFSSYNTIVHNHLNKMGVGIEISKSDKNIIYDNTIIDSELGMLIPVAGRNNVIAGNNLINNEDGFSLNNFMNYMCKENFIVWNNITSISDGIQIAPSPGKENHNVIHHNNFRKAVRHARDYIGGNIWDDDYPSGGNYWDDYEGIDGDGDGIGDTPYNITNFDEEVTGQDRYPMMCSVLIKNIPPILINLTGPSFGRPSLEYSFLAEVADVEEDVLFCKWDWGDGEVSDWLGPFSSSWAKIYSSHMWQEDGSYEIRVKLKAGSETYWSEPLEVIIESEPPSVEILKPHKGVYVDNYKILPRFFRMCLVIGDIDIIVNASDEISGVERVDFYIDGKLKDSKSQEPFKLRWKRDRIRFLIHAHIIKVVIVDNAGNNAVKRIFVRRFF